MFSEFKRRLPRVFSQVLSILRYPSLISGGSRVPEKDLGHGIRHRPTASPFGDWLIQTVAYHH